MKLKLVKLKKVLSVVSIPPWPPVCLRPSIAEVPHEWCRFGTWRTEFLYTTSQLLVYRFQLLKFVVHPSALELLAGSCKLCHGFLAHGVDHKRCKNCVGPCVVLDLTSKKGQKLVEESLLHGKVACAAMAPPCLAAV